MPVCAHSDPEEALEPGRGDAERSVVAFASVEGAKDPHVDLCRVCGRVELKDKGGKGRKKRGKKGRERKGEGRVLIEGS